MTKAKATASWAVEILRDDEAAEVGIENFRVGRVIGANEGELEGLCEVKIDGEADGADDFGPDDGVPVVAEEDGAGVVAASTCFDGLWLGMCVFAADGALVTTADGAAEGAPVPLTADG